ncbi:MAG: MoaD/ThiS family protein [Desulfurococcaceae archaeon]
MTVVLTGRASDLAGVFKVEVELPEGSTLDDLIKAVAEKTNPKLYARYSQGHFVFVTYVNDRPVLSPGHVLSDGDRVVLVTPEMGG